MIGDRINSITLIKKEKVFENKRNLIIKKKKIFENFTRFFDIMVWIRAFDAFDNTNENEKYEGRCEKKKEHSWKPFEW